MNEMRQKQTTSSKTLSPKTTGSKASDFGLNALEERLLRWSDVARMLHLSRSGVYYLVSRGDLPAFRIGRALRFRPDEVRRYLLTHPARR